MKRAGEHPAFFMPEILNMNRRIIPAVVFILSAWILVLIPFKIIGYGFLPPDDALRHAAKVISGKDWDRILVLRPEIRMDEHPGWHAVLGAVHKTLKWDAHTLVVFSVIFLFTLFAYTPIIFLRYPEAWLSALIVLLIVSPGWIFRVFLGRPYIFTIAALIAMSFLWPRLRSARIPYGTLSVLVILVALSTWIHCSWYFFILPITCFFLAREWRAGFLMAAAAFLGIAVGALLTGSPLLFARQTLLYVTLSLGGDGVKHMMVGEFRPSLGDVCIFFAVALMLAWRALRGAWDRKSIDNPIFILGALSFVLGFITKRIWLDWGMPAVVVWTAQEFQDFYKKRIDLFSWRRFGMTVVLSAVVFLFITSDVENRWSAYKRLKYLSAENPLHAPWLPEPGGIVYSDDMLIFYELFYRNPHAPWRYILGFSPALMPQEDLAVLENIQQNSRSPESFQPWVKKMRPEDRLIIRGDSERKPRILELEWTYTGTGYWTGRLPRAAPNSNSNQVRTRQF